MQTKSSVKKIAVVGAGVSSLSFCSNLVKQFRVEISVFEKSRGVGGRVSTRRVEEEGVQFDHGAQYFTARSPQFCELVEKLCREGKVSEWKAKICSFEKDGVKEVSSENNKRFVGVPANNSLAKSMYEEVKDKLKMTFNERITKILSIKDKWALFNEEGQIEDCFDLVVLSAPPPQTLQLLPEEKQFGSLREKVGQVEMQPCFALMLCFSEPQNVRFGGAFLNTSKVISWISNDSSKPGRKRSQRH